MRARSDQPAHIFWVADRAYQRMLETKSSQTVLISGDSGAGKTESAKLLIQHIAHICSNHVENLNQKIIEVLGEGGEGGRREREAEGLGNTAHAGLHRRRAPGCSYNTSLTSVATTWITSTRRS